jgi:phosphatidylglycerophosphate synthase
VTLGMSLKPLPKPLLIDAVRQLLLLLLAGGLVAAALAGAPGGLLGWRGLSAALALYLVIAFLVLRGLGAHLPHGRFGLANGVTLSRATLAALFLGIWGEAVCAGTAIGPHVRWGLVAAASCALILDGVDGWAARRSGLASPFGARFDMEIDALFVMTLALTTYGLGQAGAWVLMSGLMRYLFVAAGWLWRTLAAPVPQRRRRKLVCVLQTVALIAALAPPVGPAAASLVCALGLALLFYSFGIDSLWLAGVISRLDGKDLPDAEMVRQ